jgi:hypothetical protein
MPLQAGPLKLNRSPAMKNLFRVLLVLFAGTAGFADEPSKKETVYFPVEKDGERRNGAISSLESEWFSKSLSAMGEPSLFPAKKDVTAWRLLILPTWGHPVSVRAELVAGVYKLTSCRLDGQGGYDPGKTAEKREVTLTKDDTASLTKLLDALKMFGRPTSDDHEGLDGDRWIFEGVAGGKYHILNLWCAGDDMKGRGLQPFMDVCQFLVTQSKLAERPKNRTRELLPAK